MNKKMKYAKGFTLIEMLLVMVIISVIIYASVGYIQQRADQARIDRTTLQMQQILNAGLAYYIDHGNWPTGSTLTPLQGIYLPPASVPFKNPWGQDFTIFAWPSPGPTSAVPRLFYVMTPVISSRTRGTAGANAQAIAGLLPMGYTSPASPGSGGGASVTGSPPAPGACGTAATCWVVASVNIPGQSLNTARAVNFAGLYHHGGCVPVPDCPVATGGIQTQPQVIVVPVSVSGVAKDDTTVYPISSFTAYATGPGANPAICTDGSARACQPVIGTDTGNYWRVCLQVVTEIGNVAKERPMTELWGQDVTLAAFTRCSVSDEPAGSTFGVYTH